MDKKCPMLGGKKCMRDKCAFWVHLIGKNPQTGQDVDEFNCSIAWLPTLLIENAKNVAHNQAAIEDFRNRSVEFQDNFMGAINASRQLKEVEGPKKLKEIETVDAEIKE